MLRANTASSLGLRDDALRFLGPPPRQAAAEAVVEPVPRVAQPSHSSVLERLARIDQLLDHADVKGIRRAPAPRPLDYARRLPATPTPTPGPSVASPQSAVPSARTPPQGVVPFAGTPPQGAVPSAGTPIPPPRIVVKPRVVQPVLTGPTEGVARPFYPSEVQGMGRPSEGVARPFDASEAQAFWQQQPHEQTMTAKEEGLPDGPPGASPTEQAVHLTVRAGDRADASLTGEANHSPSGGSSPSSGPCASMLPSGAPRMATAQWQRALPLV